VSQLQRNVCHLKMSPIIMHEALKLDPVIAFFPLPTS
jgi:hypothetical protein